LLSHPVDSIFIAEYEQGDIGNVLFRVTCNMGLEGIVSNHHDRAYGAGKCKHWLGVKNPAQRPTVEFWTTCVSHPVVVSATNRHHFVKRVSVVSHR
jgi:hypothetical protein